MIKLFFIFWALIPGYVWAQSGVYVIDHTHDSIDGTKTKWTLILNDDGTFSYHFLRDISSISKANIEENFYGKGTWKAENNIVYFHTNKETDLDEKYNIDFTNSKARYITKSPRDKSDRVVKTALHFYESNLFYIKGLKLFKE
ncbi:hypothetical protein [Litoribaculum gwangyangense]|uniref:Uncharacterized protein n=1 Tax=Litoribaculum gwangyangense TaxID=1130722 RepID=A0ABP9C020_9FLAO